MTWVRRWFGRCMVCGARSKSEIVRTGFHAVCCTACGFPVEVL